MERLRRFNAFLGHGRALECALIFVKFEYAGMFLGHSVGLLSAPFFIAFNDLAGVAPSWVLALPFFATAATQSVGLYLNASGYYSSKYFRVVGGSMGMMLWSYILTKNVLLGVLMAGVNPWCVMGIVASAYLVRRGVLGLPKPGSPGLSEVPEATACQRS